MSRLSLVLHGSLIPGRSKRIETRCNPSSLCNERYLTFFVAAGRLPAVARISDDEISIVKLMYFFIISPLKRQKTRLSLYNTPLCTDVDLALVLGCHGALIEPVLLWALKQNDDGWSCVGSFGLKPLF